MRMAGLEAEGQFGESAVKALFPALPQTSVQLGASHSNLSMPQFSTVYGGDENSWREDGKNPPSSVYSIHSESGLLEQHKIKIYKNPVSKLYIRQCPVSRTEIFSLSISHFHNWNLTILFFVRLASRPGQCCPSLF